MITMILVATLITTLVMRTVVSWKEKKELASLTHT